MTKFIKLTSMILNTRHINRIIVEPNRYYIYINNINIDGLMLLGSGFIDSNNQKIIICQTNKSEDYKIITDWIKTL
jgi:hypothetical protein